MTAGRPASCPRCGARVEPGQEYCLQCGLRLPGGGVAAAVGRGIGRRAPDWLWTIFAALLVAAVMTGVAIAISRGGGGDAPYFDARDTSSIATTTDTLPTVPPTTVETEPTTDETTTEEAPPPPPPRPTIVEWPPSQNGYTVVIASMPTSGGRAAAIRKAREALASDLPQVGVLESGEFSSLHPGYYVVFSGIHANERGAIGAVPRVQRLYPAAYVRQISR